MPQHGQLEPVDYSPENDKCSRLSKGNLPEYDRVLSSQGSPISGTLKEELSGDGDDEGEGDENDKDGEDNKNNNEDEDNKNNEDENEDSNEDDEGEDEEQDNDKDEDYVPSLSSSKHRLSRSVVEVVIPPWKMKHKLKTASSKLSVPTSDIWKIDNWGVKSSASPRRRIKEESSDEAEPEVEPGVRHTRKSTAKVQREPVEKQYSASTQVADSKKSARTLKEKISSVTKTQAHASTFDNNENNKELHTPRSSVTIGSPRNLMTKPKPVKLEPLTSIIGRPSNFSCDEVRFRLAQEQTKLLTKFWDKFGKDTRMPYERAETIVAMSEHLKMEQVLSFWEMMRRKNRRGKEIPSNGENMKEEELKNVCGTCGKACLHCKFTGQEESEVLKSKAVNMMPEIVPVPSASMKRNREKNVAEEKSQNSKGVVKRRKEN